MKTITEKAEIAITAINKAISELRSQMKIQQLDKPTADKLVIAARKKAKTAKNAYFNRRPKFPDNHLAELEETSSNRIISDLSDAYDELNKTAETYFALIPIMKIQNRQK